LQCRKQWEKQDPPIDCPYGHKLPGDVTWNTEFAKAQPLAHFTCVGLGYVPFVVAFGALVELVVRRGTRELSFVAFLLCLVGLNELIWKNLTKDSRPEMSCVPSCGMPSSHSSLCSGILMHMFLDLAFRVNPIDPDVLCAEKAGHASVSVKRMFYRIAVGDWNTVIPMSSAQSISNIHFVLKFFGWFVLLAFVPVSRVQLNDHSVSQVAIGSMVGFLEGQAWFLMARKIAWRYQGYIGTEWPSNWQRHLLRHNYSVPRHEQLAAQIHGDLVKAREVLARELTRATGMDSNAIRQTEPSGFSNMELHSFEVEEQS